MSKINTVIAPRYFERIRDRIGEILIDELNNQFVLTSDSRLKANVYIERAKSIDKIALPAVVIKFASGRYGNKNQGNSDGTYTYYIEAYTSSKSNSIQDGDIRAKIDLQKLLGVCWAILENPVYKTLGFAPPSLSELSITEIDIADIQEPDGLNTGMGRLALSVRVCESVSLITPALLEGYETKIKLGDSNEGYYYENS